MINLVIDIGNTWTKLSVFNREKLVHSQVNEEITARLLDDIREQFSEINMCIISTVIDLRSEIWAYIKDTFEYIELNRTTPLPISMNYSTIDTLGKDRVAASVMGNALFPKQNVLVIEAGTAITYDFVDNKGVYQGGGISPGIDMRFMALNTFTNRLPLIARHNYTDLIGKSTKDSILSGVINGTRAEVDGIIDRYRQYTDDQLKIVLGGGDCIYFDRMLKNNIFVLQNIVREGLNKILLYNFE